MSSQPTNLTTKLIRVFKAMVLLAGVAGAIYLFLWVGLKFLRIRAWRVQFDRTSAAIRSLQDRRPSNVSQDEWEVACGWATNVYCETFLPSFETDPKVMERFGDALDEMLSHEVSLNTFDWIWDELGKATPAGKHYNEKFRPQFREDLEGVRKLRPKPEAGPLLK